MGSESKQQFDLCEGNTFLYILKKAFTPDGMGKKYKYTLININLPQGPVKSTTSLSYRRQV